MIVLRFSFSCFSFKLRAHINSRILLTSHTCTNHYIQVNSIWMKDNTTNLIQIIKIKRNKEEIQKNTSNLLHKTNKIVHTMKMIENLKPKQLQRKALLIIMEMNPKLIIVRCCCC